MHNKMTKAIHNYMLTIFNCSYQALQEWGQVDEDYPKWLARHQNYVGRINRAFIKCYKDSVKSWPKIENKSFHQQELVNLLQEIIQDHLKYRSSLFKGYGKLNKKYFIWNSAVQSYYLFVKNFVRSIKSLAQCYTIPRKVERSTIVIVKNFPSHGFSLSKQRQKTGFSFGDYLKKHLRDKKVSVLSIDEYKRPSQAKEHKDKLGRLQKNASKVKELKREVLQSNMAVLSFFSGLASLLTYMVRERKQNGWRYDLWFSNIRRLCCSKAFSELCKKVNATGSTIYKNYFLGYSGTLGFPIHAFPEPIEFLYAANVCNPPQMNYGTLHSIGKQNRNYKMCELTLTALKVSRSSAGFSHLPKEVNEVKQIINRTFNVCLPVPKLKCDPLTPTSLGFESEYELPRTRKQSCIIALFDTPPDSRDGQIGRSIFGDLTHDFFVVQKFLEDIVDVAAAKGFVIFHKPKYSFANYIFQYRNLVDKLRDKYKDSYHLISPYNSLAPLLTNCRASFSFIGSSTHVISKKYCLYSFVYIPNSIIALAENNDKDIIAGRNELSTRLDKIRKKTRYVKSRR